MKMPNPGSSEDARGDMCTAVIAVDSTTLWSSKLLTLAPPLPQLLSPIQRPCGCVLTQILDLARLRDIKKVPLEGQRCTPTSGKPSKAVAPHQSSELGMARLFPAANAPEQGPKIK